MVNLHNEHTDCVRRQKVLRNRIFQTARRVFAGRVNDGGLLTGIVEKIHFGQRQTGIHTAGKLQASFWEDSADINDCVIIDY